MGVLFKEDVKSVDKFLKNIKQLLKSKVAITSET
jgi:hypothetical protein